MIKNPSQGLPGWSLGMRDSACVHLEKEENFTFTEVHLHCGKIFHSCLRTAQPLSSPLSASPPATFLTSIQHSEETQVAFSWNSDPQSRFQMRAPSCFGGCELQPHLTLTPTEGPLFWMLWAMHCLMTPVKFSGVSSVGPWKESQAWRLLCSFVDRRSLWCIKVSESGKPILGPPVWTCELPTPWPMTDSGRQWSSSSLCITGSLFQVTPANKAA